MGARIILLVLACFLAVAPCQANEHCDRKKCFSCHTLSAEEAEDILGNRVTKVGAVTPSIMPGIWEIEGYVGRTKLPIFMDFSKKYYVVGVVESIDGTQGGLQRLEKKYPILGLQKKIEADMRRRLTGRTR